MKSSWRIFLYLVTGLAAALVIGVEGAINPFTVWIMVWNVLPLLLAGIVVHLSADKLGSGGLMRQCVSVSASGFSVAVAAVVSLGHLAWLFDWGGTATGSSTSALLFVVLPPLALFAGILLWAVIKLVLWTKNS